MLSTLAKIAYQLERDGHHEMADQLDDVISAIATRDPFDRYAPGEIWEAEQNLGQDLGDPDDQKFLTIPNMDEEMESEGLQDRSQADVGLGYANNTYSAILEEFSDGFSRWLAKLPEMHELSLSEGESREGLIDSITDQIEQVLDNLTKIGSRLIDLDPEFATTAKKLILKTLESLA